MQDLPSISFKSEDDSHTGIEIISLADLIDRRKELDHDPQYPHKVKFFGLFLYTEGSSEHLVDFESYPVKRHTLIYISNDQVHAFKFNEGLNGYGVLFTQQYFERQFRNLPESISLKLFTPQLYSPVLEIPDTSNVPMYFQQIFEESRRTGTSYNELVVSALFNIILAKAEELKHLSNDLSLADPKSTLLLRFIKLIAKHHTKSRSAQEYATRLGVSYKHLNATCGRCLNQTAKAIIDDYVVLQAKRKLTIEQMRSSDVAYDLGFGDPTNFTKFFRQKTGTSPKGFIKQL